MKILHLSDFHLGHRCYGITRRQQALRRNFTENHKGGLCDVVNSIEPDVILLTGDNFDNSSPTWDDVHVLREWISHWKRVVGITGNHDKLPDSFMQASAFLGIENPGTYGDMKILCHNHMFRSVLKNYADNVEECDILMLHQSMCGFLSSIMKPEIDEETANILSEKCSYLALGDLHIHNRMKVNNCIAAYPGPIDFLRVGESHNKFGAWLLEEKGGGLSCKSVEIKPNQKTTLLDINTEEDYINLYKAIESADNDFFVIKAVEHPTLLTETKLLLNNRKLESEMFCFHVTEVESSEDESKSKDLEEASSFDEDFMNIVRQDKTIEEEDKQLASDLWSAQNPKAIHALLAQDLKDEQARENK